MPRWLDRSPKSRKMNGHKSGLKRNSVAVCGSLSQRLSNAVISNAHTPLITRPVTGFKCWMALRERVCFCVRVCVGPGSEVVVFTQSVSSGWPQAGDIWP